MNIFEYKYDKLVVNIIYSARRRIRSREEHFTYHSRQKATSGEGNMDELTSLTLIMRLSGDNSVEEREVKVSNVDTGINLIKNNSKQNSVIYIISTYCVCI